MTTIKAKAEAGASPRFVRSFACPASKPPMQPVSWLPQASHAQKYFIRQSNTSRRKRRSNLFDMVPDVPVDQLPVLDEQFPTESSQASEAESTNQPPPLNLSLNLDCKPMKSPSDEAPLETKEPNVSSHVKHDVVSYPTLRTSAGRPSRSSLCKHVSTWLCNRV